MFFDGFRWFWKGLGGFGRVWEGLGGFGRVWEGWGGVGRAVCDPTTLKGLPVTGGYFLYFFFRFCD